MKRKICLILALSVVIFISGGCEEYDMPVDNDINITQTSETSEFESSTETEAYTAEETVLSETTESQTSEALSTQETSESPGEVLTVITGRTVELELAPEELFEYTVSEDLMDSDLENLKPHKRISLMVEKEGIDISRIAELGSLDELWILQGQYWGLLGEVNSFIADFTFLDVLFCDAMELTTLSSLTNLEIFSLSGEHINYDIEIIYELTWLKQLEILYKFINDEQIEKYREINPECLIYILDL